MARRSVALSSSARRVGIHLVAGKGSGKSRLIGRVLTIQDAIAGMPTVLIDPHGPSIDNFLDRLMCLQWEHQESILPRILYVDMAARDGYVVPFPLYYRMGGESLAAIAQRFLDVIKKLDPALQSASVQGWNAILEIGVPTGMVLYALGCQVTEAQDLLFHPKKWLPRIEQAARNDPSLVVALEFFRDYAGRPQQRQDDLTRSFLGKAKSFIYDDTYRAMFGADAPGFFWDQAVADNRIVLLDFRHVTEPEQKRFKLLWTLTTFLEFVKNRGAGRTGQSRRQISLVIDEIMYLLSLESRGTDLLGEDLDELINQIGRNYSVSLTLAHQEMHQLSERAQNSLLGMGTQVFGVTTDHDTASLLARRFFPYEPLKVKKHEPMYMSERGAAYIVDHRPVEYSIEEQVELNSRRFTDLKTFQFLIGVSEGEGRVGTKLIPMTTASLDPERFVDEEMVTRVRRVLAKHSGKRVQDVLATINARQETKDQQSLLSTGGRVDTLEDDGALPANLPDDDPDEWFNQPSGNGAGAP